MLNKVNAFMNVSLWSVVILTVVVGRREGVWGSGGYGGGLFGAIFLAL